MPVFSMVTGRVKRGVAFGVALRSGILGTNYPSLVLLMRLALDGDTFGGMATPRTTSKGATTKTPGDAVDAFVSRAKTWQPVIKKLRTTLLGCGLEEDIKWGKPTFIFEGSNVAIIQPFKEHCSLMFFKGALLEDTHGLLRSQGENSQSALRLEFTSEAQVKKAVLKSYVDQAIAVEKKGLKVEFKAKHELELPDELTLALKKNKKLAKAWEALTPGRRRAYVMHVAAAKQSETRTARIEKATPQILDGKGMNDR